MILLSDLITKRHEYKKLSEEESANVRYLYNATIPSFL